MKIIEYLECLSEQKTMVFQARHSQTIDRPIYHAIYMRLGCHGSSIIGTASSVEDLALQLAYFGNLDLVNAPFETRHDCFDIFPFSGEDFETLLEMYEERRIKNKAEFYKKIFSK